MGRTIRWTVIVLAIVFAGAVWLAVRQFSDDGSLDRLRAAGVIRVGYSLEPPYAFTTPDGTVTGQSPELVKEVIARLGIGRIEWRVTEFGSLLDELEQGHIDVVAAGMYITPERARRVAFSEPMFRAVQGLLVREGNPLNLHSYADLAARPNARAAALSGAVEMTMLRRAGLPESRLIRVPDILTGFVAVEAGLADGLALSAPTLGWMSKLRPNDEAEPARPFVQPSEVHERPTGYGAFAFRLRDRQLLRAWNRAQVALTRSPEYRSLLQHFGFPAEALPGDVTTGQVLQP